MDILKNADLGICLSLSVKLTKGAGIKTNAATIKHRLLVTSSKRCETIVDTHEKGNQQISGFQLLCGMGRKLNALMFVFCAMPKKCAALEDSSHELSNYGSPAGHYGMNFLTVLNSSVL
ncbi:uncharacterized protein PHALS_14446 [Plasmopara halstedii]|uniref:Uncharacterized protein n=1 Tax=Plasmopara halstedii TaxID=4781 RepID=A0A0P1AS78_PLAHL|nr:uncharacterized protein PHALS_14446 [Plasmopara halstedii]CEG44188.1 hypothetical protein PHALS_14446 [Plasmopara halstedii]|eukprot:XP_024580557.1 hypothetical protein PHALS_14446 [Plasmopara halstedii]